MKRLLYAAAIILLGTSITIAQSAGQQEKSSDQKREPKAGATAPNDVKANQSTATPRSPIQAGQAADEAERGAQAAARAEIRPGATLGVGTITPQDVQAKSQETAQSNTAGKKSKPVQKAKQP